MCGFCPLGGVMGKVWNLHVCFASNGFSKEYWSGDLRRTACEWGDIVFSPIESLEFFLPTKHVILLSGMEKYNFFVEVSENLGGGKPCIEAFWLCGKLPGIDTTEMWRVGNQRVIRERKPFGREWGGAATRGWKAGNISGIVTSKLVSITSRDNHGLA